MRNSCTCAPPAHSAANRHQSAAIFDQLESRLLLAAGIPLNAGGIGAHFTMTLSPPSAPLNVVAQVIAKNRIRVSWTDASNNETGFMVQRSTNGSTWSSIATVPAGTTSYTNGGLKRGTYYYRVLAYNSAGQSACSQAAYASLGQTTRATKTMIPRTSFFSTQRILSAHRSNPCTWILGGGRRQASAVGAR